MTTKGIVFDHIRSTKGKVNLQELTAKILQNDPSSKWDQSHWSFYRTQIISDKGRYAHLFTEEIKQNLRLHNHGKVERYFSSSQKPQRVRSTILSSSKDEWPQWDVPSDEEQVLLAKTLMPYVKMLAPAIVAGVVADNNKNFSIWHEKLERLNIRPDIYLWEGSPVAFPGIRRHVGSTETNTFRSGPKLSKGQNALYLDDNTYPKQLWSFALRNKRFGMKNPAHYSLAHIVDHKDHNTRNQAELSGFEVSEDRNLFAGLYTSCANCVYIPTSFLKPTDHNSKIRQLLIQIVHHYYGNVCNPLPFALKFNLEAIADHWRLKHFPQPEVVGKVENLKSFLFYRNTVINQRITQLLSTDNGV